MKILVTGGAGFLGSYVVEQLIERGVDVTVVFDRTKPGKIEPLEDAVEWIHGDIRSYGACQKAIRGVDVIIHLAALINVDHSRKQPLSFYEVNVQGTMNLLEAARREEQTKKFVYMGTCEVYGNVAVGRADELWPCDPRAPYGASKYAAERYCFSYHHTYGTPEIVMLRGFNFYGPRQSFGVRGAVIPIFIDKILNGVAPVIFGDGKQSRDYTFAADTARAAVAAALTDGLGGEIINVCSGQEVTINHLADRISKVAGSPLEAIHVEGRPGEIVRSVGDNLKAKRLLNWTPQVSFDEGLLKTLNHFQRLMRIKQKVSDNLG